MIQMVRPTQQGIWLLTLLLSVVGTVRAGVVLEIQTTDLGNVAAQARVVEMFFSHGFMKMAPNPESEVVYNQVANSMTIITHSKKVYMVMDKNFATSVKSQMDRAMAEALAKVPAEQREMLEKMMQQPMGQMDSPAAPAAADIRQTRRKDTVNGFECIYYEYYEEEHKTREYCVAQWDALGSGEDISGVVRAMAKFSTELAQEFSNMAAVPMSSGPFADMSDIDGFPVLTRRFSDGRAVEETVLTKVTNKTIADSEFQPPAGYVERNMGMSY